MKLDTYTYADVSTAHITLQDSRILTAVSEVNLGPPIVYGYEEGYFVHIPEDFLIPEGMQGGWTVRPVLPVGFRMR